MKIRKIKLLLLHLNLTLAALTLSLSLSAATTHFSISCRNLLIFPQEAISQSLLLRKAQPISQFTKNSPRHLNSSIQKVLFSRDIKNQDLPYSTGLRPPVSLSPAMLLARSEEINQVYGLKVTDIILGSDVRPSIFSLVRLGFLPNGRPVAVKTVLVNSYDKIRNEIRSASILADIGVFPIFHGVWRDGREFSLVTDIVPGEINTLSTAPSLIEITNLMLVFKRLTTIGIFQLPAQEYVPQYIRSSDDSLLLIDADGFYEHLANSHPNLVRKILALEPFSLQDLQTDGHTKPNYMEYEWGRILGEYIIAAKPGVALSALAEIKSEGGILFEKTIEYLSEGITFRGVQLPPKVTKFVVNN